MLRSHFLHINLKMVLEEGGTDFRLGFRSKLEDVLLDGKCEGTAEEGEVEEREGEEKEAEDEDDDSDDAEVEDSRSTNSTNESR